MAKVFLFCGRILARFHRWSAAVFVYSLVRPISRWDEHSRRSFAYCCLLSSAGKGTQRRFARILERDRDRSFEQNLWLAKTAWYLNQPTSAMECYEAAERLGSGMAQREVARALRQFTESLTNREIYEKVANVVNQIPLPEPGSSPIVLTIVSSKYLDLFDFWLEQTKRHADGHLLVLALDQAAKLRVERDPQHSVIDISSYFAVEENGDIDWRCRSMIWVLRVVLLRELISRGYSVHSLDLDAVLLSNLQAMLSGLPPADIIAQKDYSIPVDVARELGFVLCCGFMAIRSNPRTLAFLNLYCEQTMRELDDQLALNHLLGQEKIAVVESAGSMSFQARGISWACPHESLVSRDVRYGSVIRHFQQTGQSIQELRQAMGLSLVSADRG